MSEFRTIFIENIKVSPSAKQGNKIKKKTTYKLNIS